MMYPLLDNYLPQRFKEWVETLLGLQPRHVLNFFGHTTIDGIVYSVCQAYHSNYTMNPPIAIF